MGCHGSSSSLPMSLLSWRVQTSTPDMSDQGWVEGKDHLVQPTADTISNAAQDAVNFFGHKGILLAHSTRSTRSFPAEMLSNFLGTEDDPTGLPYPDPPSCPSWRLEWHLLLCSNQEDLLMARILQRWSQVALQWYWPAPSVLLGTSHVTWTYTYPVCLNVP